MRKLILTLLVAVCFGVTGCASVGKEMTQSQLDRIKPNQTTKAEMIAMFGEPVSQSYDSSGKITRNWQYVYAGAFGVGLRQQVLSALFDEQDIVEKYTVLDNKGQNIRMGR